jgi:hypothetical protein
MTSRLDHLEEAVDHSARRRFGVIVHLVVSIPGRFLSPH